MSWNGREPDRSEAQPSPHCSQMPSAHPRPFGDQGDTRYRTCWQRGSCFPRASTFLSKHPLDFPVVLPTCPLPCSGQTGGQGQELRSERTAPPGGLAGLWASSSPAELAPLGWAEGASPQGNRLEGQAGLSQGSFPVSCDVKKPSSSALFSICTAYKRLDLGPLDAAAAAPPPAPVGQSWHQPA